MAPTPMKAPGLMSSTAALLTPNNAALSVRLTFTSPSLAELIASTWPSKLSTVPDTRSDGGCWAYAPPAVSATAAAANMSPFSMLFFLTSPARRCARHTWS